MNAPGVLCPTCVDKEAEIVRYDTWHSERRQQRILWAAIVVIGAIVFAVNWFKVGK